MGKQKLNHHKYNGWQLYGRLFTYVKVYQLALIGSIFGYIVFAATSPLTAWWLGMTVDAINAENYEELRIISPILCVLIVIIRGAGGFLGSYSLAMIANNVIHKFRCELIDHLITLPSSYFDTSLPDVTLSK
jgi:subfamily B ATP-binding cassette protein MsbA